MWLFAAGDIAFAQAGSQCHGRFEFTEVHMGVPVKLTFYAANEADANAAARAAFDRFAELDSMMSDYNPESELLRLCGTAGQGKAVPVSDDLWRVLVRSQDLAERTDGAFDVTVGPIVRLWRRARRNREFPSAERLAEARAVVGYRHLRLLPDSQAVELLKPGMRLDLGGIAMGYAADEALALLRGRGIRRALVDASGDIAAGDPPPGENGWRIGFALLEGPEGDASRFVLLANAAITTSGDAYQHVVIDGVRYSHIVDPQTGLGLTDQSTVTVLAKDCVTADSLATAVSVLGPERGLALVESVPGAAAHIVRVEGEEVKTYESGLCDYTIESP